MSVKSEPKNEKKGFWARLFDKLDAKMQEKARSTKCCCCSDDTSKDKTC